MRQPVPLPHVLIDQREVIALKFSPAVTTERVLLPVADYSIRGGTSTVAIERKRGGELASCCGIDRDRFLQQMENLRPFACRHLVIEATYEEMSAGVYRSNIRPASVIGTMVKLASDWTIPVWFCGNARGAAELVERILIREHRRILENEKRAELAQKDATIPIRRRPRPRCWWNGRGAQ